MPPPKTLIISNGPGSLVSPTEGPKMDLKETLGVVKAHSDPALFSLEFIAGEPTSSLPLGCSDSGQKGADLSMECFVQ